MRQCAVIMAGGSGTRLWPLSRQKRPKQLLRIVEGRSLIDLACDRLRAAFDPKDIYIIALADHLPAIAAELPYLPKENLIGEPIGRDTSNAIAMASAILHERDPDTVMGIFTADHLIRPTETFVEIIRRGFDAARQHPDALVTFGIKPTEPHTGLGYVERGEPLAEGVYRVASFKEKPDLATARDYLATGRYYWNSGMFVWRTETILAQLRKQLPASHDAATKIAAAWNSPVGPALAAKLYPSLEKISIDFAVMEKAPTVLVVEMALDWLDVGNWTALPEVVGIDDAGNTAALKKLAAMSSKNNIIVSEEDHLIATIGVEDLVIIHSPDATLICHRNDVQRIKDLVGELNQKHGDRYA